MTDLTSAEATTTRGPSIGRRFIPLLSAALILMIAAFAARAQAATPYPIHTLAESTSSLERPSVATDANGDQVAVWSRTLGANDQVIEAAVRPFGDKWSTPVAISASGASAGTPDVAVNAAGEAIATWMRQTAIPRWEVEVSRLDDIGATPTGSGAWSAPLLISGSANAQQPEVGIDADGVATAAWRQAEPNTNYGAAVASEIGGGAWSAPQFLSEREPSDSNEAPRLVVDPAGDAAVIWNRSTAIETATKPAGGTWTTDGAVASAPSQGLGAYSVAIDDAGEVNLAWEYSENNTAPYVIQAASKPLSGSWSTPQTVSGANAPDRSPLVSVTPDGHAFLVWISEFQSIESVERAAGGAWTAPAVGPALTGIEGLSQVKGGVDSAGNATLVIEGELTGSEGALWVTRHSSGGAWTQPMQINDTAEEQAYRPAVAVDQYGDAAIAWNGFGETARFVKAISIDNSAILTVEKSGSGSGVVSDDLGKIDCGTSCVARYPLGTQVTLTAKPSAGSTFAGWSGDCTGTGACTVALDAAKSVKAEFSPAKSTAETKPTIPITTAPKASPTAPLRLVKVKRNKARGVGATKYWVPAAGTLTIYGPGVKKASVKVSKAGFKFVKLTPKGAYRARLARNHRGFTVVKAKFRPAAGGKATVQKRRVRLVWRHG